MVPFADQINHENVDVNYDCFDKLTGKSIMTREEIEEKQRRASQEQVNKQKDFLVDLKNDLETISKTMIREGPNEHNTWRIQTKNGPGQ